MLCICEYLNGILQRPNQTISKRVLLFVANMLDLPTFYTCEDLCSYGLESTEYSLSSPFTVVNPGTWSYDDFFRNFLMKNVPCILSSETTKAWSSISDWKTPENKINFDKLDQLYGDCSVNVTHCKDELNMAYDEPECESMKMTDYLKYLKNAHVETCREHTCLYLKDWHIVKSSKNYQSYVTPEYFQSDWLNEAWEETDDDFRFCYIGPLNSWTPFHCDVYGSYSWSANILGRKKWRLYPPGKEKMFKKSHGKIIYDSINPGVANEDFVEIIQDAGQIIFVPSGWHHIVWNLEHTVSINHNWFNGSNICYVWQCLVSALHEVQNEICDLNLEFDEFQKTCQSILFANHGMNYLSFLNILELIYKHRLDEADCTARGLHRSHVDFDKFCIKHVLSDHVLNETTVIDLIACDERFKNALNKLKGCLMAMV